ncbi:uncharacterized protein FOMMEDRAFT_16946 [Fomitiporia mediterranea MF3/22]|uniref:uncharacterized protein n=1 Tax=Fomitiporia mediterranea (strain MF3/22) TaxID=694068 RepID=UPI00044082DC|nr:uncharacterized protein FOMMEDRAFT_16946 [Fomitiporia mediterranea MF3/22]EJD06334.1 hypothetical protein FOMMEDRAFT_16946 [Fomitiporia mediterranea MF3/22]
MSSKLLSKAGLKLFEQHLRQYEPVDPVYETYVDDKGKTKRRRRELPPGLSARDAKILRKVKSRAHHLDKGFRICGMRFGWTFVIGLIPVVGDGADAFLNYMLVVRKARQAEIPSWLVHRMLFNNALSAGIGFIPVVGDVGLAVLKANSRNALLLEEYLRIRGEEFLKLQQQNDDDGDKPREDPENVKPGAGRAKGEKVTK